jgi:hypothetical protein
MTSHTTEETLSNIELQFTISKLRSAQVELLLLEEDYQKDGDYRGVIDKLEAIILKLQCQRRF